MYNLHLALQDVRARATANLEVGDKAVRHGQWSLLQAPSSRTVSQSPYYFDDADLQFLRHSSFSEECATLTYHWIKSLAWPETDAGHLGCITGATWVELSLSWTCFNRKYIPVLRKDHMGIMRSFFFVRGPVCSWPWTIIHWKWYHAAKDDWKCLWTHSSTHLAGWCWQRKGFCIIPFGIQSMAPRPCKTATDAMTRSNHINFGNCVGWVQTGIVWYSDHDGRQWSSFCRERYLEFQGLSGSLQVMKTRKRRQALL